jgi:PAS domain S-box-containing protein
MTKNPSLFRRPEVAIPCIYAVIATLWIAFSDKILAQLAQDAEQLTRLQTYKGSVFVLATAILLFFLVRMSQRTLNASMNRLRSSEERLRATLENTPHVAVQWFDREGRVLYWNTSSERLYGIPASEALGQTIDRLGYSAEQAAAFRARLDGIAATGEPVGPYDVILSRPGGSQAVILCTTFAIPDDEHGLRFACMDIDLTEQRTAERALAARERRYRALVEQVPVAVIEWSVDLHVTEWNAAAEQIFGYTREQALGQHARFILPPDAWATPDKVARGIGERSGGEYSENDNVTADGRRITCLWSKQPLLDGEGRTVALVSTCQDVTETRRVERQLRTSEEKFQALFQSSPVAIAVSSLQPKEVFVDCNDAWLTQFQLSGPEVVGRNGADLGLWIDPTQRHDLLDLLHPGMPVRAFEARLRRRDGAVLSCLLSGQIVRIGGQAFAVVAFSDVTEERRIRQELRQFNASLEERVRSRTGELLTANQELRKVVGELQHMQGELVRAEKLAALGALVAGVAHELNTPLGNALMAASTLAEHTRAVACELNAVVMKRSALEAYVNDARVASDLLVRNLGKASELVTSFKQVAVDQTSSRRRQFRVGEVISEILVSLRPTFRGRPILVDSAVSDDIDMDSYPGPLGQVLTNLINNSVVHGFSDGRSGRVLIAANAHGDEHVEVCVKDDGVGIPSDILPRIFDPFFTTRFGKGGSGLGLRIVHSVVTNVLGGRVAVDSRPGYGSAFTLILPRKIAAP